MRVVATPVVRLPVEPQEEPTRWSRRWESVVVGGNPVWHFRHVVGGWGMLAETVLRPRRCDYRQPDWEWHDAQDGIHGSWFPVTRAGAMEVVNTNNLVLVADCQEELRRRRRDREEKSRRFWSWVASLAEEERRRRLYLEYCQYVADSVARQWKVRMYDVIFSFYLHF